MATDKEPFANQYECSKFGRTVVVGGIKATLRGGPGAPPLQIGFAFTVCSGMPHCGFHIGQIPCPHPRQS
jgi:hypothetical protein